VARLIRRPFREAGLPPGTLVGLEEGAEAAARITVIHYDAGQVEQREAQSVAECKPFRGEPGVTWINVDAVHRADVVQELGDEFSVHPLVLEDIMNLGQRPKAEDLGSSVYVVLNMLYCTERNHEIEAEQVSLILGEDFVISFQEKPGDVFNAVRERIVGNKGQIRQMGPDYLLYSLIDAIVDNYFAVLEHIGERIEALEVQVVEHPGAPTLREMHNLKRQMIFLRKSVWPLRELVNTLERRDSPLISEETGVYFRDVYDHTIQVIEAVETYRDMVSGMLDIYLSTVSNRMNEIMKVLTVMATLFIPLTFITGVYGMNFRYMPELQWRYGYPLTLLVMWGLCVVMVVHFKRRKWL